MQGANTGRVYKTAIPTAHNRSRVGSAQSIRDNISAYKTTTTSKAQLKTFNKG